MPPRQQEGARWYEWIPGWLPVCGAICAGALWIGQYTQGINDRLTNLEAQVKELHELLHNPPAQPTSLTIPVIPTKEK